MYQQFLNAFVTATSETFSEMFDVDARADLPREITPNSDHAWDITALIGLAGHAHGVIALRLTSALAAELLAGSGVESASEGEALALRSGFVAELANILSGKATTSLSGVEVEIAPPVVVRGPGHSIGWPAIAPVVAVPFALPSGNFELDLCVKL